MSKTTELTARLLSSREENIEAIRRALRWLRSDPVLWAKLARSDLPESLTSSDTPATLETPPAPSPPFPEV